jgi:hypothetical protein
MCYHTLAFDVIKHVKTKMILCEDGVPKNTLVSLLFHVLISTRLLKRPLLRRP